MKRYKWGILGTGKIANRFGDALSNIPDEAELYAVASRTMESANKYGDKYGIEKRYEGYETLVSDPEVDIVYVGTPGKFHLRDVTTALEAGKHVLCEKAFTLNSEEAESLINLATAKNLFLMEGMWTRFFPVYVKIREIIQAKSIGDLRGFTANFAAVAPAGKTNRFWDVALGASSMMDVGAYGISMANHFFGEPLEIAGLADMGEGGFDYQSSCILKYNEGRMATIMSSQTGYEVKNATLFGTDGKIEINDPWYKPTSLSLHIRGEEPELMEFPLGKFIGQEYEIRDVMSCIDEGKIESSIMPLKDSLNEMKILDNLRAKWGFKFPGEKQWL
ncbi:MAG: Gfo/Idh/MocA family oxidoreductase [Spirochaetales bacterium]|nr:Gfo/Idh/MocA family oxidoreductase [Spirochaetales bacterium]